MNQTKATDASGARLHKLPYVVVGRIFNYFLRRAHLYKSAVLA